PLAREAEAKEAIAELALRAPVLVARERVVDEEKVVRRHPDRRAFRPVLDVTVVRVARAEEAGLRIDEARARDVDPLAHEDVVALSEDHVGDAERGERGGVAEGPAFVGVALSAPERPALHRRRDEARALAEERREISARLHDLPQAEHQRDLAV